METQMVSEKKYTERSPTLQTLVMVEEFIKENNGSFKKTELFNKLPRKVMWQTFQTIMSYLEENLRIAYDKEGYVVYIWNPKLLKKINGRNDLEWSAK